MMNLNKGLFAEPRAHILTSDSIQNPQEQYVKLGGPVFDSINYWPEDSVGNPNYRQLFILSGAALELGNEYSKFIAETPIGFTYSSFYNYLTLLSKKEINDLLSSCCPPGSSLSVLWSYINSKNKREFINKSISYNIDLTSCQQSIIERQPNILQDLFESAKFFFVELAKYKDSMELYLMLRESKDDISNIEKPNILNDSFQDIFSSQKYKISYDTDYAIKLVEKLLRFLLMFFLENKEDYGTWFTRIVDTYLLSVPQVRDFYEAVVRESDGKYCEINNPIHMEPNKIQEKPADITSSKLLVQKAQESFEKAIERFMSGKGNERQIIASAVQKLFHNFNIDKWWDNAKEDDYSRLLSYLLDECEKEKNNTVGFRLSILSDYFRQDSSYVACCESFDDLLKLFLSAVTTGADVEDLDMYANHFLGMLRAIDLVLMQIREDVILDKYRTTKPSEETTNEEDAWVELDTPIEENETVNTSSNNSPFPKTPGRKVTCWIINGTEAAEKAWTDKIMSFWDSLIEDIEKKIYFGDSKKQQKNKQYLAASFIYYSATAVGLAVEWDKAPQASYERTMKPIIDKFNWKTLKNYLLLLDFYDIKKAGEEKTKKMEKDIKAFEYNRPCFRRQGDGSIQSADIEQEKNLNKYEIEEIIRGKKDFFEFYVPHFPRFDSIIDKTKQCIEKCK